MDSNPRERDALDAFHAALAAYDGGAFDCWSGDDWVDGTASACVKALLEAGWSPPPDQGAAS